MSKIQNGEWKLWQYVRSLKNQCGMVISVKQVVEKMGHRYRNGMQIIAELIYYHQIITNVHCIRMRQEKAIVAVDAI